MTQKQKTFVYLLRKILVQPTPLDSDIPSSNKIYWCSVRLPYRMMFVTLFATIREQQLLNLPHFLPVF